MHSGEGDRPCAADSEGGRHRGPPLGPSHAGARRRTEDAGLEALGDLAVLELLVESALRIEEASDLSILDVLRHRDSDRQARYVLHVERRSLIGLRRSRLLRSRQQLARRDHRRRRGDRIPDCDDQRRQERAAPCYCSAAVPEPARVLRDPDSAGLPLRARRDPAGETGSCTSTIEGECSPPHPSSPTACTGPRSLKRGAAAPRPGRVACGRSAPPRRARRGCNAGPKAFTGLQAGCNLRGSQCPHHNRTRGSAVHTQITLICAQEHVADLQRAADHHRLFHAATPPPAAMPSPRVAAAPVLSVRTT